MIGGTQYVPNDNVRDLPDVSLFSANGYNDSFYPICATDGDCQSPSGANLVQIYGVGGTSASSPAFAGIMALVVEKWGRQGQAGNILYPLKAQYPAAFHEVTNGTNSVPCEYSLTLTPDCISVSGGAVVDGNTEGQIGTGTTPEYNAAAGYNLATGLGTIDANNLVNDWNKIKLTSTATTLTASETSFTHGTPITISGAVTGTGTPTGNVALMTDSTEPISQGQAVFSLSGGSYTSATSYPTGIDFLPGGTYHIWGQYGGDANNAMSTSTPPVLITVTPETPGMDFNIFSPSSTTGYFTAGTAPGSSVDYGTQLTLSALVAPTSQLSNVQSCVTTGANCSSLSYTSPTGTVTFTDDGTAINTAVVNVEGDAEYNAPFAVGAHSVAAAYSGDQSYNKISSSANIGFTVVKDNPEFFWGASNVNTSNDIIAGQPTVFTIVVENGAQYNLYAAAEGEYVYPVPVAPPTGQITLSSQPSGISGVMTLSSGNDPYGREQAGIGTVTLPSTLGAGTYNVTLTYSGDANYNSCCTPAATAMITVVAGSALTVPTIAASTSGAISPNSYITVTGTVTGSGSLAPTGTVTFYSSGNNLGYIVITPGASDVSNFLAVLSSQDLLQGANFINLQYSGDTHYAPSEFTLYGSNSPLPNPQADFSLVPDTTIVPINISTGANSGADTINVSSVNTFNGTVNLSCAVTTPATPPLTCTVTPNPSVSNGNPATSTLTINVPASTPNGNYDVVVTGVDATTGEYIHTLAITADVSGSGPAETLTNSGNITVAQGAIIGNTSTITVTPSGGFTGTVNLTCAVTSAPAGATDPITCAAANLNPASLDIINTGALTSALTVNTTSSTTTGDYKITVTGTSGALVSTTVVDVTVNLPADFAMSNSGAITVNAGTNSGNTSIITVAPSGGFTGTVNLTCVVTTAPVGATNPLTCAASNLSPTSVDITGAGSQTSTLTANTTATTTQGAYVITVTGTAGTDVHTTTVNVAVNAAAATTIALSNSGNITVSPGATSGNTSTISVTPSGGFNATVALTCTVTTALPSPNDPPTCGLAPNSLSNFSGTTAQTSTLTVTTTAATAGLVRPNFLNGKGWMGAGSGAVLAVLIFFGIPARRRSWRSMLGLLVAMAVIGAFSSCGGGSSGGGGGGGGGGNTGTTEGTYTVTVTGTSGSITQTTSVTLSVE